MCASVCECVRVRSQFETLARSRRGKLTSGTVCQNKSTGLVCRFLLGFMTFFCHQQTPLMSDSWKRWLMGYQPRKQYFNQNQTRVPSVLHYHFFISFCYGGKRLYVIQHYSFVPQITLFHLKPDRILCAFNLKVPLTVFRSYVFHLTRRVDTVNRKFIPAHQAAADEHNFLVCLFVCHVVFRQL